MIQNYRDNYAFGVGAVVAAVLITLLWPGLLPNLLSAGDFVPHGHCYLWRPGLVWLHLSADALIGIAYVVISVTLAYLVHQTRREIPFHWMFLAFGIFIIACGITHFMEVWTLWHPTYWLAGGIKLVTAIASCMTALFLPPLVPQARSLLQAAKMSEERREKLETANQELNALYTKVRELDQTKMEFFANVSHDLRTPLALILGPIERLLQGPDALTPQQRINLELVERNAQMLLYQVNDLLDLAKTEMGRMELHYSAIDLAQLVRTTAAQFETLAVDRQIDFRLETPPSVSAEVDPEKLQKVLLNLLSNAFKFTPAVGNVSCVLQETTTPSTDDATPQRRAIFSIQDSGPGIPVEEQEAVFRRFYAKPGGDTQRFGSTGLGLAIVKDLVELHQGRVSVTTPPTGGACFTVELPLEAPVGTTVQPMDDTTPIGAIDIAVAPPLTLPPPAAITTLPTTVSDSGARALAQILVVEDNPDMNWLITTTLAKEYRVVSATDGHQGVELAIALQPDLILSDVMMPGLTGEQLVQMIRRYPALAQTPIILLTARADNTLRIALLRQGVQDYLTKPFSMEELLARVGNLVAMKQARQILQAELATQSEDLTALASELTQRQQELQAALEALQESESRFRRAILDSPFPVCIHADDGTIVTVSHSWTAITGYTPADIPTMAAWLERAYGDRQTTVKAGIDHLYTLGHPTEEGEFTIKTASGEERIWDFSSAPLGRLPDGRRLVLSMARDITDRKKLEQRLRQQAEELAQANRLKDDFLATLSHELRTPLNAILGWAKLLQSREFDALTRNRALETIERNARQQSQLIEDLLEISRIIQGKLRLNVQPVNPMTVVEAAIESIRPTADAKTIQLKLTSFPDTTLPLRIMGDTDRLQQVVWNLLSNAVKFTPDGGHVEVELSLRHAEPLAPRSTSDWVQIRVSDTGVGIKPDFLPQVFDRFRQADSSITRAYNGLGLGLAIVRHLVELHGGQVWAESAGENQGATFVVVLPLLQAVDGTRNTATSATQPSALSPAASPLQGLRALIVDDDEDTRAYLTTALHAFGMEVITAGSAIEAIQALSQARTTNRTPDILVSDIGMPNEDGYALMRRIRALEPVQGGQIPAIALTAYASEDDRNRSILAGFQLHLAKPVEPSTLIAAIATLTGRPAPAN